MTPLQASDIVVSIVSPPSLQGDAGQRTAAVPAVTWRSATLPGTCCRTPASDQSQSFHTAAATVDVEPEENTSCKLSFTHASPARPSPESSLSRTSAALQRSVFVFDLVPKVLSRQPCARQDGVVLPGHRAGEGHEPFEPDCKFVVAVQQPESGLIFFGNNNE